jgi:hypothetical protein
MFGATFDLKTIGADKLPKDILIPGKWVSGGCLPGVVAFASGHGECMQLG